MKSFCKAMSETYREMAQHIVTRGLGRAAGIILFSLGAFLTVFGAAFLLIHDGNPLLHVFSLAMGGAYLAAGTWFLGKG